MLLAEIVQLWAGGAVVCPQDEHEPLKSVPQLGDHLACRSQRDLAHIAIAPQDLGEEQVTISGMNEEVSAGSSGAHRAIVESELLLACVSSSVASTSTMSRLGRTMRSL